MNYPPLTPHDRLDAYLILIGLLIALLVGVLLGLVVRDLFLVPPS